MLSTENIKNYYLQLEDSQIEDLAKNPKGLRTDIVEVLNTEILRRNLNTNLIQRVKNETAYFNEDERLQLIEEIKNNICPTCNLKSNLKGYQINTITSFILYSNYKRRHKIICSSCANKERLTSMFITLFMGLWSRTGIVYTPMILITDLSRIFFNKSTNNQILKEFIDENTGIIRLTKNNSIYFNAIIERYNNTERSIF